MAAPPLEIDADEGTFTLRVKVRTEAGEQVVERQLDLFEAHNAAAAIADRFPGDEKPVEQAEAWVEWLTGKGIPPLTHAAACRVALEVRKAVDEFKKKAGFDSPSPD